MAVEGLDRLGRRFRALPNEAARHIEKALDKSGAEVRDTARALAPVDTGDLKDSIEYIVRPLPDDKGAAAYVIVEQFYGRFVEFGSQGRPARPYFFPAYRLMKKRVRNRIKRAVKKAAKITNGR